METLLKASQVARLLNVKTSTVYDLCYRRVLPHLRLVEGRRRSMIRFREEDLEMWVKSRQAVTEADETAADGDDEHDGS